MWRKNVSKCEKGPLKKKDRSEHLIEGASRESGWNGMRSRTWVEELANRGGGILKDFVVNKRLFILLGYCGWKLRDCLMLYFIL